MPHISVVSPVYRAEECIGELCRRLKLALGTLTEDYEIILVEDCSPDASWKMIEKEASTDDRVRGMRLARNFGQHFAITAGLDVAAGDWVVVMDCDLQDPPEQIPNLYSKAQGGYKVVVASFEQRSESVLRQWLSRKFWGGLSWMAGIEFDPKIGNFRIMSKDVVDGFKCYREQLRFLGGILSLMGFNTAYVSMPRADRFSGRSSYNFRKLMATAIDIVMAYSDKPLKISVTLGLIMAALSIMTGVVVFALSVANVIEVPGWASVMVSLYLIGGLIIANLGVIGYYLGRTYDEAKRRPLYMIDKVTFDNRKHVFTGNR